MISFWYLILSKLLFSKKASYRNDIKAMNLWLKMVFIQLIINFGNLYNIFLLNRGNLIIMCHKKINFMMIKFQMRDRIKYFQLKK